jgi:hypothetical protein
VFFVHEVNSSRSWKVQRKKNIMKTSKTNQHSAADLLPVRRDATRQHTFIKLLGRDTGVKLNVFSKKKLLESFFRAYVSCLRASGFHRGWNNLGISPPERLGFSCRIIHSHYAFWCFEMWVRNKNMWQNRRQFSKEWVFLLGDPQTVLVFLLYIIYRSTKVYIHLNSYSKLLE